MCNKSSNITNREFLDVISSLGEDECVGRCLWCCLLRPRVDIGLAGSDAYCHQAYSTPDPPCLRPVKCATKRPIDRGQQCNWWSSTACGQDPAIVANLLPPRRWVDFSLAARWLNPPSPSWRYPAEMVGIPQVINIFIIAKASSPIHKVKNKITHKSWPHPRSAVEQHY